MLRRKREGPGKSYLVTPKPRGEVTRALLDHEKKETSFRPSLDKHSIALAKRRGRAGGLSILSSCFSRFRQINRRDSHKRRRILKETGTEGSVSFHRHNTSLVLTSSPFLSSEREGGHGALEGVFLQTSTLSSTKEYHPDLSRAAQTSEFPLAHSFTSPLLSGANPSDSVSQLHLSSSSILDPNLSSINLTLTSPGPSPSLLSTVPFIATPHLATTVAGTRGGAQSKSISRLSESNIAKALLSFDQSNDHPRHPPESESDNLTDYNEEEEEVEGDLDSTRGGYSEIYLSNKSAGAVGAGGDRYLLSDDDDSRRDERASPPPPPFSVVTSTIPIDDLLLGDPETPPLPPPPAPVAVESSRLYRYSSFGDIDSTTKSPQQQSVIQRVEAMKMTKQASS
jgi:hypothetical protein